MVRSVATEPKTGFTGVVFVASSARFRTSMAVFKAGITSPRPFRCWELSIIVETQDNHEEAVRRQGCEEEPESQ